MNRSMSENPIVNKKMKKEESFEYYLLKKVGKTIKKYGMIENGDRILVGVSGGKDSFTMLKILHDRKGFYPNSYELLALHIVSDIKCDGLMDSGLLESYLQKNGYSYKTVEMKIEIGEKGLSSFWCSWNRRRMLFEMAKRLGFNKVALGHHRNDVIETLLLNMFYHAEISTMLPVQRLFEGKITIIRPLYNIPESDTRKFSRLYNFPAAHCSCPFEKKQKRDVFKRLLNEVEKSHPKSLLNALRALENIKEEYLPLSVVKEDIVI